jgi:hypothetical protein
MAAKAEAEAEAEAEAGESGEAGAAPVDGGPAPAPSDAGRPLATIVIELMLMLARADDVVRDVAMDPYSLRIRKGDVPVDPATFTLHDAYDDPFALMPRWARSQPVA